MRASICGSCDLDLRLVWRRGQPTRFAKPGSHQRSSSANDKTLDKLTTISHFADFRYGRCHIYAPKWI
jgi:hypothetical protein